MIIMSLYITFVYLIIVFMIIDILMFKNSNINKSPRTYTTLEL